MLNRGRPILAVSLTALAVGLLCVGLPGLAKPPPPPPPPPPTPQYKVLDLGVRDSYPDPVMNDQGQVACIADDGLGQKVVVITPRDSNGDGFWDSVSKLTILMPDRAWFVDSLGLTSDQELGNLMFWGVAIGKDGVVSGTVGGYVYSLIDEEWSYEFYRGFVVKPADSNGDGINDVPLTDLGVGEVHPGVGDIECFLSTSVFDMNESGCIVGIISTFHYNASGWPVYAEDTNHAFRIVPKDTNGDGIGDTWFEDTDPADGVNDLIELLGASGSLAIAVDDAGRVYVSNQDGSGFVVFPDGYESKTKSSLDQMWIAAGNSGGLAVGSYRTGRTFRGGSYTFPVQAPCLIQGLDTGGVIGPDLWFRDANNDGKNDLMVKLGTLSGYTDESKAVAVNDGGEIVGYGVSSTSKNGWVYRALIWKNRVAVDLNTLISQPGVVLREASAITQTGAITQKGAILCGGTDAAGAWHGYLLMP
jgi:hypothetical protein